MRAALYLRTSNHESNLDNQRGELVRAAVGRGWEVLGEFKDDGVSGAKRRDRRPGLDDALKAVSKRQFDVLMVWSVDRLGRSLVDLMNSMESVRGAGVQLYIHKQAIDTSTPAGAAMFGMLGVFAEFERSIIRERILTGMERARLQGKRVGAGQPPVKAEKRAAAEDLLRAGQLSIRAVAKQTGVSVGMVHKIKCELGLNF